MKYYEHEIIVGFEETNLVGNVYYANHVRWQGRCREMFLRDLAPDILIELTQGLILVTTKVSCEYFNELYAFDKIELHMRSGDVSQNRITMLFDYYRTNNSKAELIAKGEQQIACMRKTDGNVKPTAIPSPLLDALEPFMQ